MTRPATDWMAGARWGVFFHFLADTASAASATAETIDGWNARVDAFDVDRLADQLVESGTKLFGITLGQNSGYFCSPNATYDRLTGITPSRLSRRDLVADLIESLARRGIRVMAYLPSHAPAHHPEAARALACVPPWDARMWSMQGGQFGPDAEGVADERLMRFQQNWEAVVAEWSRRWGEGVSAWWIDGCYYIDRMYHQSDTPNFESFSAALRSGNRDALVTFNEGIRVPRLQPLPKSGRDYFSGEADFALPVNGRWYDGSAVWPGRTIVGEQLMVFTFLGRFWGQGPLRFNDSLAAGYTKHVNDAGGFVLWDTPHERDGTLAAETIRQFRAIQNLAEAAACG